jgi:hypothetical protein
MPRRFSSVSNRVRRALVPEHGVRGEIEDTAVIGHDSVEAVQAVADPGQLKERAARHQDKPDPSLVRLSKRRTRGLSDPVLRRQGAVEVACKGLEDHDS